LKDEPGALLVDEALAELVDPLKRLERGDAI
jgi:hypothetical protein